MNGRSGFAPSVASEFASGDLIVFLSPDTLLAEDALYEITAELELHPEAEVIYGDHDWMDDTGMRSAPHFKADFDPDLLLAQNFLEPLTAYRKGLVTRLGPLWEDFDGAEDLALALRATRVTDPARIRHIPAILAHRRQGAGVTSLAAPRLARNIESSLRAVQEYLAATAPGATAEPDPLMPQYRRIRWPLPNPAPLVSVIVPTRDHPALLAQCLSGVLGRTDYPALEVIVVDNDSKEPETLALFDRLQSMDARCRVIQMLGKFNYAKLNNVAARAARGEVLLLLNNDIKVIGREWLQEMVTHAVRPNVGAVGAKLLYADGRIQHAGVVLGTGGNVASHFHYGAPRTHPGYFGSLNLVRSVSAVTGACLALRREVFEAVDGFDETNLSIGYNDVDLCLRIREKGLRIVWTPFSELYHLESASRGADIAPEAMERLRQETAYMKRRWGHVLEADPYYNPNLSLARNDFGIDAPPRRLHPWKRELSLMPLSART
jgi:GT2 family glycosyltransferase